ncbi:MAG: DNA photolyase [Deltaproteobacteria bacterium]|nr:DNA photolyase [Deltaproteobacteria bacterium]MBW1919833.1 DNA photolyase [Deltaproteobacteria bacterium]MBW1936023.1 DNA photolyase [Deltaproteobacteria bacterium]MBW1978739.1 DNA photolyase [Deltaproteobacteria bacterium]MBW2046120.1 DNA photolyase [Deltaproteobacteria bacterium]
MDIKIERMLVQKEAKDYPMASRIRERGGGIPVVFEHSEMGSEREWKETLPEVGKQTLELISFKGEFLKPCPGTKEYICCGYQILNIGTNCPLDCSYCILQAYFIENYMRIFVNLEAKLNVIAHIIDTQEENIFRIGTGEFTDSLALDPLTGWSEVLVSFISKRKNAVLEFKTKTDQIRGLLNTPTREGIIISWSLNSPSIAAREERGAPSLRKRLEAARQCQQEGFVVGLHFDPLIEHPSWRKEYVKTLELLDKYLDPRRIIWVSLGSFRFMPSLKPIVRKRHPRTCIFDGEFVIGLDGKMRYFKPIRMEMYGFMREKLEQWYKDLGLYLCMESDEVWKKSMGWSPGTSKGLSEYLDKRVLQFFGAPGD